MPLALFTDTYVLVARADALLAGAETWESADTPTKEFALRTATTLIDSTDAFLGVAVDPAQPLAYPRLDFTYWESKLNLPVTVPQGVVPLRLEQAVAQQALHLLTYPSVLAGYDTTWDSITVGPISLSNQNASSDPGRVPRTPYSVRALLKPLQHRSSVSGIVFRAA